MGDAIRTELPMAVGVALSPVPIIAVILMLVTSRARTNGPAFILGWLLGLALVGVLVLGVAGPTNASEGGAPATWFSVLEPVLGVLLLLVALRQLRARPASGEEGTMPKWMGAIDQFKPGKAL